MAKLIRYLNSFRMALPVAFPATRRPTRLPTLPFLTALWAPISLARVYKRRFY